MADNGIDIKKIVRYRY